MSADTQGQSLTSDPDSGDVEDQLLLVLEPCQLSVGCCVYKYVAVFLLIVGDIVVLPSCG